MQLEKETARICKIKNTKFIYAFLINADAKFLCGLSLLILQGSSHSTTTTTVIGGEKKKT